MAGYSPMTLRSFVLFIAFVLAFAHGTMEAPFDTVIRRALCLHEFSTDEDRKTCRAAPQTDSHELYRARLQLSDAMSGAILSYPAGRIVDCLSRASAAIMGISFWVFFQLVGELTINLDPRAYYLLVVFVNAGILLTKIAFFAMITDLSTNAIRPHNHVCLAFVGLAGHMFGQLVSSVTTFLRAPHMMYIGAVCLIMCNLALMTRKDTQKSEKQDNRGRPFVERPIFKVLGAIAHIPTAALVIIAATISALGPVVIAWLERHLPAAYDISPLVLGVPLRFWLFGAVWLGMAFMMPSTFHAKPQNLQEDRCPPEDLGNLLIAFVFLHIGNILLVVHQRGPALGGVVMAGLGSGTYALPPALLLCIVGPELRSMFTGRMLGMLYLVQNFFAISVLETFWDIQDRLTMSHVGMLWVQLIAVGVLTIVFVPVYRMAGPATKAPPPPENDIELQNVGDRDEEAGLPAAPPPAYAPPPLLSAGRRA